MVSAMLPTSPLKAEIEDFSLFSMSPCATGMALEDVATVVFQSFFFQSAFFQSDFFQSIHLSDLSLFHFGLVGLVCCSLVVEVKTLSALTFLLSVLTFLLSRRLSLLVLFLPLVGEPFVSFSLLQVFDLDDLDLGLHPWSSLMTRSVVHSFLWAVARGFSFLDEELIACRFLDGDLSWIYTVLGELDGSTSDWSSDLIVANVLFRAPWIMDPSSSLIRDCISLRMMLLILVCSVPDCSRDPGVVSKIVIGGGGGVL